MSWNDKRACALQNTFGRMIRNSRSDDTTGGRKTNMTQEARILQNDFTNRHEYKIPATRWRILWHDNFFKYFQQVTNEYLFLDTCWYYYHMPSLNPFKFGNCAWQCLTYWILKIGACQIVFRMGSCIMKCTVTMNLEVGTAFMLANWLLTCDYLGAWKPKIN